jgi:uncharacterized RDD family membrane protein YckC
MAVEELNIQGLTGVGLTLRVAGPGTRAYAFLIDWHIRIVVVLACALLALIVLALHLWRPALVALELAFGVPALLLYVFYHPVLELLMRGQTPGKRIAGARIVTLEGATPGAGALLIRNVFRLIDGLPSMYLLGLLCCLLTAQRVRIGDLAAGTVLVLDERKVRRSLGAVGALAQSSGLAPDTASLVRDLLDRWTEMEADRTEALARALLARIDARLDPVQVAALDRHALRAKLEGLLAGG